MVTGYEQLKDINSAHHWWVASGKTHSGNLRCAFPRSEDEAFDAFFKPRGFDDADRQAALFPLPGKCLKFSYGVNKPPTVVVKNTRLVADWVENVQPIPDGTFPPFIAGAEEDIRSMSEKRAAQLYGSPLPALVRERLDKELTSIIKNGFSVMYIIAQKLVSKSLADGYLVGSRGSVGSSFVAYLTGITEVNSLPAHYRCENCLHAEFLGKDSPVGCGFDLPEKHAPIADNP